MDAQEFLIEQPENIQTILVENLNCIICKQDQKHKIIDDCMKPKDSTKVDIVKLEKTYPEENALPEDGL